MRTRYVQEIGTRVWLWQAWGECPRAGGRSHVARKRVFDSPIKADWKAGGEAKDHPESSWPGWCEKCGAPAARVQRLTGTDAVALVGAAGAERSVVQKRLYDTPDGVTGPGDVYLLACWRKNELGACAHWDNCPGVHLHVVLPEGSDWEVDGRASNCGRPEDRAHRCWVRSGPLDALTVGKDGDTCAAGGGSIAMPGWHGFLRAGELISV